MSTLEWVALIFVAISSIAAQGYLAYIAERNKRETSAMKSYVRQANRDFAEAAALLKYGATQEAIDLLAKYDREGTE